MQTPLSAVPTPDPRRWLALVIVLSAAFLAVLDFFILNVSIPAIQADLGASYAQIQWLIAGYGLAYAVFLITGGRLGDIFGRKRMFMIGVSGFTLGSALCGMAMNAHLLVAARVLQGLTAAVMFPQVLSIIQVTFPPEEKSRAFAVFGSVLGLAAIAAQIIGGILVDANILNLHWRPIFLVNLPVGILALLLAVRIVPESRAPYALRPDIGGVAIGCAGLLLLLFPLVQGRESGWPPWMLWAMAASAPMMFVFVRYEKWKTARDGSPLVELALFRDYGFAVGLLVSAVFYCGLSAFFMTMTLFLQNGVGFNATRTGYVFVPFATGFFLASLLSARIMRTLGRYIINAGAVGMIAGLLGILWLVQTRGLGLTLLEALPITFVYGFGQGCVMPQLVNIVLSGVEARNAGSASGVLTTIQQISLSGGVAWIGNIFFTALGGTPSRSDYVRAIGTSLKWNVGLLVAAFLLALMLPRCAKREALESDDAHLAGI